MQDRVRDLTCRHCFHLLCLDGWFLRKHNQYPLCRAEIVTRPQSKCTQRQWMFGGWEEIRLWFSTRRAS